MFGADLPPILLNSRLRESVSVWVCVSVLGGFGKAWVCGPPSHPTPALPQIRSSEDAATVPRRRRGVDGGRMGWGGVVAPADVGVAWRPLYLLEIYISDKGLILLGQLKFLDRPRYKLVAPEERGGVGVVARGRVSEGGVAAKTRRESCEFRERTE